jgi:hypothetical protein
MKSNSLLIVRWSARIITILFAAFISIFALDVFTDNIGFWPTVMALFIHLIPTFIVIMILWASWRWEWIGGLAFTLLLGLYFITKWGKINTGGFVMISAPMLIVAILFFTAWFQRKTLNI